MRRMDSGKHGGREPKSASSTRERILLLMKTRGRMSASELAAELKLTEMAIRRHMYELEHAGSVQTVAIRQQVGRPLHKFELTAGADELFPKNYHALALDLLTELDEDPETAGLIDRMFEGRMRKLRDRYLPRMKGLGLKERVEALAAIQNEGGYMAQVEKDGDSRYTLHEYNCPITGVAGKYGQACGCELALFRSLLEVPVERTECLSKGGSRCSYTIDGKANS